MTYPLSPGNRVVWYNEFEEIRGTIKRLYKNKALIKTTDFEEIKVPLDELELVPVVTPVRAACPMKVGDRVSHRYFLHYGIGTIKQIFDLPISGWRLLIFWEGINAESQEDFDRIELVREQNTCTLTTSKNDCTLKDDECRWNPDDFGECDRLTEPDGQKLIFFDTNEPPDPDDFISLEEYEKAYRNWKEARSHDCTLTTDTEINFNPKDYPTTQDWLDDSINQFFYEEGEYELIVPTFPDEPVREQESVREQENNCTLTPDENDCTLTTKLHPNRWIEEKMIKRSGKLHGPYRYERWRDESGKMKSKYLGKKPV
ncbi:hypothetical protein C7H19_19840 [Aphanothece hegewaldii CCALA 016]|uniref:Uncharacterized protein n=1 Tax=Aphanothece hegewaldii CCALA 016 TaxID=2107694 RepID=A0A2T1LTF4_9CHRO|nr:hypothetical protein [Aphanothece hegewaldii]PSF33639.1 hypothetical protein C7H19_19840 [Aphanothece hegewaldii CCALA 016]